MPFSSAKKSPTANSGKHTRLRFQTHPFPESDYDREDLDGNIRFIREEINKKCRRVYQLFLSCYGKLPWKNKSEAILGICSSVRRKECGGCLSLVESWWTRFDVLWWSKFFWKGFLKDSIENRRDWEKEEKLGKGAVNLRTENGWIGGHLEDTEEKINATRMKEGEFYELTFGPLGSWTKVLKTVNASFSQPDPSKMELCWILEWSPVLIPVRPT